ncbi:MAG: tetratricopeptide repeat protein [Vicinamibacterales bacterium]
MGTTPTVRRATVRQLAHKIKGTGSPEPRFCVFLGAGASYESGIPLAGAMMEDFRRRICEEEGPTECSAADQRAWLLGQQWYRDAEASDTLYSALFERYEANERGRQIYVERMIRDRKPSFGYVVLANLIARNYINTVLTTNFDDLVNEACATFTDIRPVTYAYGVMVSDLRIGNPRPRILKLHGDYLYSRLKNSKDELQFQDANMSRSVPLLLNEYGLIVIGYSGCDESVMDLLRQLAPGNDLYWCGLPTKDDALAPSVRRLLDKTGGAYVEIESFDKMMSEVRSIVGFDVPKMFGAVGQREDAVINQLKRIARTSGALSGFDKMAREICEYRRIDIETRQQKRQVDEALVHYANSIAAWGRNEFALAESEGRESLRLDPTDYETQAWLAQVLAQQGQHRDALDLLEQARRTASGSDLANIMFAMGYSLEMDGRADESIAAYEEGIRLGTDLPPIGRVIALNGLGVAYLWAGRLDEARAVLLRADAIEPTLYYPACNLATLCESIGEREQASVWWNRSRALFELRDWIDLYNDAIIDACLGHDESAIEKMTDASTKGQQGLAHFALLSVRKIASGPNPPKAIGQLAEMLERAVADANTDETRNQSATIG